MKAEYVQPGNNLDYINPTEDVIKAGTIVFVGAIAAVAATNIAPDEVGAVATDGVWKLPKGGGAITAGAKVYYDAAADTVTTETGTEVDAEAGETETETHAALGVAVADASADAAFVSVKLNA